MYVVRVYVKFDSSRVGRFPPRHKYYMHTVPYKRVVKRDKGKLHSERHQWVVLWMSPQIVFENVPWNAEYYIDVLTVQLYV